MTKRSRLMATAVVVAAGSSCSWADDYLDCSSATGQVYVNADYTPNSSGAYRLLSNWGDADGNGLVQAGDGFAMRDENNQAVRLGDPCIFHLRSQYGSWFYITGTSDVYSTANFPIYRTRDFKVFELHMLAFDNDGLNNSQQLRTGAKLQLGADSYYRMYGAQLTMDQADPTATDLHMIYSAIENHEPSTQDATDFHSVYHSVISISDFLSWHTRDARQLVDGPRFDDPRTGRQFNRKFGYTLAANGPTLYDGGYSTRVSLPGGGEEAKLLACTAGYAELGPNCGQVEPTFWGKRHRCHPSILQPIAPGQTPTIKTGITAMFLDAYVFYDPRRPVNAAWRRGFLFSWNANSPDLPFVDYGSHIAAAPLLQDMGRVRSDVNALFMAYGRNATPGTTQLGGLHSGGVGPYDNGASDIVDTDPSPSTANWEVRETNFAAIAEGPSAFYNENNGYVYMLYSRNAWNSPAYQIVYRKTAYSDTEPPLRQLRLSAYNDRFVEEKVLLRSSDQNRLYGRNFGNGDIFRVRDSALEAATNGAEKYRYYLIAHVKFDGNTSPPTVNDRRTVIFKELTFLPNGDILPLVDNDINGLVNPAANVWKFIMPVCTAGACCRLQGACTIESQQECLSGALPAAWRGLGTTCSPSTCTVGACCAASKCTGNVYVTDCAGTYQKFVPFETNCANILPNTYPCCAADFNGSGSLDSQDIFDFLNAWFAGCLVRQPPACPASADVNNDGVLSPQDTFDFLNMWEAGCV